MEKTKLMLEFEQETGKQSAILKFSVGGQALEMKSYPKLGPYDYNTEYLAWLEAKANISDEAIKEFQKIIRNQCDEITALKEKAEAYDHLMSGGRKTLKEWANMFGKPVVINACRIVSIYENIPRICCGIWCGQFVCSLSRDLYDFNGDWRDSLTLPDGWEES